MKNNETEQENLRKKSWIDFAILYFIRPKTLNFILFVLVVFVLRELTVLGLEANTVQNWIDKINIKWPESEVAEIFVLLIETLFTKGNGVILIISILLTSIVAFLKLTDINKEINSNIKILSFLGLVAFTIGFSWYNLVRIGQTGDNLDISFEIADSRDSNSTSDLVFYKEGRDVIIPSGVLGKMENLGAYRRRNGTAVPLGSRNVDSNGDLIIGEIESSLTVEFNLNKDKYQLKLNADGGNYELKKTNEFTLKIFDVTGQILDEIPEEIKITKGNVDEFKGGIIKVIELLDTFKSQSSENFFPYYSKQLLDETIRLKSMVKNFDIDWFYINKKSNCKLFSKDDFEMVGCLKNKFERILMKVNSH